MENLSKEERRALSKSGHKPESKNEGGSFMKKAWLWILVILGVFGVIALLSRNNKDTNAPETIIESSLETDRAKGKVDSEIMLVEYADFQCPACATYYPMLKDIESEYGDRIKIVFRHFPLVSIHPNAVPAAVASEAAGEQGAFWGMHDILFARQDEWSQLPNPEETFVNYARELGLDEAKFKEDLGNSELKDRVMKSLAEGNQKGVNATPTFYLNGQKLNNPRSLDEFRVIIENVIETPQE